MKEDDYLRNPVTGDIMLYDHDAKEGEVVSCRAKHDKVWNWWKYIAGQFSDANYFVTPVGHFVIYRPVRQHSGPLYCGFWEEKK